MKGDKGTRHLISSHLSFLGPVPALCRVNKRANQHQPVSAEFSGTLMGFDDYVSK